MFVSRAAQTLYLNRRGRLGDDPPLTQLVEWVPSSHVLKEVAANGISSNEFLVHRFRNHEVLVAVSSVELIVGVGQDGYASRASPR